MSHDTFNNFTRVSSEICKTKYISLPPLQVRVQIVCQSQVTRITITTQSLVYGPRSQYLKFSRFDDLFYAQFHISCIRAHLRNNYKKISSHWAWLYYDPFIMRPVPHTTSETWTTSNHVKFPKCKMVIWEDYQEELSWGFRSLFKQICSDIDIEFWSAHSELLRSQNNLL